MSTYAPPAGGYPPTYFVGVVDEEDRLLPSAAHSPFERHGGPGSGGHSPFEHHGGADQLGSSGMPSSTDSRSGGHSPFEHHGGPRGGGHSPFEHHGGPRGGGHSPFELRGGADQLGSSGMPSSTDSRSAPLSPSPGPADLLLPPGAMYEQPHSAMGLLHPHQPYSPNPYMPPSPAHASPYNMPSQSAPVSPAPHRAPSSALPEWGWPHTAASSGPTAEAPRRLSVDPVLQSVLPGSAPLARKTSQSMRRNKSTVKRGMTMRGAKPQISKVRVVNKADNKSYFSVERTTYQWIYMSTALLGSSLTFFAVEAPDFNINNLAQRAGTLLAVLSLVVMYYAAFFAYRRRRALDRLDKAAAFDDQAGPIVMVAIIVIILIVHQVLSLKNVVFELHRESFGPKSIW